MRRRAGGRRQEQTAGAGGRSRRQEQTARVILGNVVLMASDAPPGHYSKPQGISISIQIQDVAEGERIFNALAENGTVQMPFGKTFWAAGFGMCIDRFGTPWMVNCDPGS